MLREFLLVILICVSAVLAIIGRYSRKKWILYVFKPLTLALIIFKAALSQPGYGIIYQLLIMAGLVSSLAGDIFLMLPGDKFSQGLLFFLFAQIIYSFAFSQNVSRFFFRALVPVLLFGTFIYWLLHRNLGKFHIPVLVYMIVISFMAWLAINRYLNFKDPETFCALLGGILFLISDSILALKKFKKPFMLAQVIILATYFSAQLLVASSF